MEIKKIAKIKDGRQDGAVKNGYLFSFNGRGECTVYLTDALESAGGGVAEPFAEFVLDKNDIIVPHSNAVMFGNEYYDADDEFPLLYTNIYNNYSQADDKLKGVCLVYRIQRNETKFVSTLVQMIEIGFVEDENLWKSAGEKEDVRPYGNFVVDSENSILYAYTMRDNTNSTRYFSFELPKVNQGKLCEKYNVNKVILNQDDIISCFDCAYHHFLQGGSCHDGKIYSLEGFTDSEEKPPAIRVIDTKLEKEILFELFGDYVTNIEPELIDFDGDTCYYSDHYGNVYKLFF